MKRIIYLALVFMLFGVVIFAQDSTRLKAKEAIFTDVESPEFPGGERALMAFINSNVQYPRRALQNGVSGIVVVRFLIDKEGVISDSKVIRSLGGGCDGEAIRVIKAMPKWLPGKQGGVPVPVWFTLPIRYNLRE
jgi:protein TonB